MPTEDFPNLLSEIRPYVDAFFKQQLQGGKITRKTLAGNSSVRPADISEVFRYLRKESQKIPIKSSIINVHRCLTQHWTITDGVLKPIVSTDQTKLVLKDNEHSSNNEIILHENFEAAKPHLINDTSRKGYKEEVICVLNTYLSSALYHNELDDKHEGTINNWLLVKGKNVRLLLLKPDGKAMRLRTNTDLEMTGDNLAVTIISNLRGLLRLQERCRARPGQYGQLDIKVMDELPGMSCVITPRRIFQSIHYSFGHSEKGTLFEVTNNKNSAYRDFKRHFDTLWENKARSQVLTSALLDQMEKGVNITLQNNRLNHLPGKWMVYIHDLQEAYLGNSTAPQDQLTGGVAALALEIEKPNRGLYLKAKLSLPGREGYLGGSVNVITEHFLDRYYAHIRFSDMTELSVHISIRCNQDKNEAPLFGHFVMNTRSDACSGPVILRRVKSFDKYDIPFFIKRQLAFVDGGFSSLELINKRMETFESPFPYAGTYKVYSYGENRNGKCIKINLLKIDEWGQAKYKNQNFKEEPVTGRATHIGMNLHLVFSNYKPHKRRSYWIVSVKEVLPEPGRFYSAIHLGVSWLTHLPTGKRYILEYTNESFDAVMPITINLHTKEYYSLPFALRKLMSGRTDNLIGFLRQRGDIFTLEDIERELYRSVNWDEVFADSACQLIERDSIKSAIEMLARAVNHGFERLDIFENIVKQRLGEEALLNMKKQEAYQNILKLLPPDNPISPII
jgi:hypothetical protein